MLRLCVARQMGRAQQILPGLNQEAVSKGVVRSCQMVRQVDCASILIGHDGQCKVLAIITACGSLAASTEAGLRSNWLQSLTWLVMDTGAVSGSCTSSQRQTKFDLPIHSATSGCLQRSRKHHTKKYQHMTTSISRATSSHLSHTFAHNTQSAHVASQKTCRTHSRGYSGPTKGFYRLSPPELRGSDAQSHASSCRRPATTSSL